MPHIGWNPVSWRAESPLTAGLPDPCAFYHVHSFAAHPARAGDVLGVASYGREFTSVVARPPVFGTQFHPEKSGPDGLRMLGSFAGALRVRARMILLPAVDIREGRAVNLRQGHFDQETVYADDPLEAARSFVEEGARFLHLVDLDGALEGRPANLHHLERIASELDVPVQWGGGLRTREAIARRHRCGRRASRGWHRGLLGPATCWRPLIDSWGPRILVGVDARGGRVSVSGWTRETELLPEELIDRLQARGAQDFVCTNADLDGMLGGVDVDEVQADLRSGAGHFHRLRWDQLARRPARAAEPRAQQPRGRDLRQGPPRASLHDR